MSSLALVAQDYLLSGSNKTADILSDVNSFALPKIEKISINIGVGKSDNKEKQEIADYIYKLVGQKPKMVKSRLSISNFKLRKGDVVGLSVTLRGKKIADFLLNLIYLALPRTRDFKGIGNTSFDKNFHSYSLGIENTSIFPAIGFSSNVTFGMQINIVFKTGSEDNKLLLQNLGFPFAK